MDDTPIFDAFVHNVLNIAVARARTELIAYIPTFRQLMTISEKDIDEFMMSLLNKFILPTLAVLLHSVLYICLLWLPTSRHCHLPFKIERTVMHFMMLQVLLL